MVFDPNRPALPRARCTLPVLYEDAHVLVVDKPAGLLTVPSAPGLHDEDTALRRVQDYARRLKPRGAFAERVHRLDRDTSGAIAFALSPEARAGLIQTFRDHRIERAYVAVVAGEPREESGLVDAPLREEWTSGRKGVARGDEPARPALTRWAVRERFPGRPCSTSRWRPAASTRSASTSRTWGFRSSETRSTGASRRSPRGLSCTRPGWPSHTRSRASASRSRARCRTT